MDYSERYTGINQATRDAQRAAEKAASGKTPSAPLPVLTPEQRQANMARDLALSQTRGARPSGQNSQFYQPAYQSQYQNYNSSAQPVMNQQTGQPSFGNTLTPELARTLMQRSMTPVGTPTSEFNKYGGYAAVRALYDKSGGDYSGNSAPYPQQQQQQQAQFNPYTNSFGATGGAFPTQTPFSYQQPAAQ